MVKWCSKCRQLKTHDEFYLDAKGAGGRRSRCKPCYQQEISTRWRALSQDERWERSLRSNHPGMPVGEYAAKFSDQGGVCALCKQPPMEQRLVVDHDHRTGKRRGLLHYSCNNGLGMFQDSVALLGLAIAYLQEYSTSEA